ncbi:MAG: hypothetical protein ACT4PP_03515 [Sporichthyaceae bacterium]
MTTATWDERIAEAVRRSSWRLRFGVLTLISVIVVSGVAGASWWSEKVGDLTPQRPRITYIGVVVTKNAEFSIGLMNLNHPGKNLTVLKVEALTSPNVEFLGAFTVWPRDAPENKVGAQPGFPPKTVESFHSIDERVPASETAVILPGYSETPPPLEVAAGFRLASGDVGAVNGIRVTYRVGNESMSEVFRYAAIVCIPDCKKRADWSEDDFSERTLRRFNLLPDDA